ncbi:MAG: sorbosone dehydrogenase family protein [Sphingomonadales bacterium]|jgi:glucose/arabinose dehydrogenase
MNRLGPGLLAAALLLAGCDQDGGAARQTGANPPLPAPQRGLFTEMAVAEPGAWGNSRPTVPAGWRIAAIATGLKVPRQVLVLPNGDLLIAEGKGGGQEPALRPKDFVAKLVMKASTSSVAGGNRLTLLRDADGDGVYEGRFVFAEGLNAPYGLALAGGRLFVANQDALVSFAYTPGQTRAAAPARLVTRLPAEINHHWTKSLTASADGRTLFVGIGSNSNIAERGMAVEENRAMIWAVDAATGGARPWATGIRNPTALAIAPGSGQLFAVANERDELGPDLVPDYLTSVREGAFYGWPYAYWGQHPDTRVQPFRNDMLARAVAPDYALGSHVAPLGLAFSGPAMGARLADGVFIGLHGSWNRARPAGYKVVFVAMAGGRPQGAPIDIVTGFQAGGKTLGRPAGVAVDPRGALIVCDDLANIIWRIVPAAS